MEFYPRVSCSTKSAPTASFIMSDRANILRASWIWQSGGDRKHALKNEERKEKFKVRSGENIVAKMLYSDGASRQLCVSYEGQCNRQRN